MGAEPLRWLLVGLGNPGTEYEKTRHNIGAMVVDHLASLQRINFSSHKSRNLIAEYRMSSGAKIVLAKPNSYMNTLGGPVKALRDFYSIENENIIALHDELDIDYSAIRIKFGGGENGHNGLKSISSALATKDYFRLRLGIGRPPGQQDPADFVLNRFNQSERSSLPQFLERAGEAIEYLIENGLEKAQSQFNS
jgi:peptidyl-tRNA hydrolase, PTH1 family